MFVLTKPNDMDITIDCQQVDVRAKGRNSMELIIEGANIDSVFANFKVGQVVDLYFVDDVLNYIGVDRVKEYFNLTENEG